MKLRSETRENIRLLSRLPDGFTVREVEAQLGWSHQRTRMVLKRLDKQKLFHTEGIYIYIEGERAACDRARGTHTNRRVKVNHYRLTEHALSQIPPEPPKRFIPNSVFQLAEMYA